MQVSLASFKKNLYLTLEGTTQVPCFYIIQSGTVFCSVRVGSYELTASYGPGDCVGVISCISQQSQVESIVATSDVTAVAVSIGQYPMIIAQNNKIAFKIIQSFSAKVRALNDLFSKFSLHSASTGESAKKLFDIAAYYDKARQFDIAVYAYFHYLFGFPEGEFVATAKQRYAALKDKSRAVYLNPTTEVDRTYPADTLIFAEGESGSDMFILQKGTVKITRVIDGHEVVLAILQKKGDFFGEMALLENKPRSANAIAAADSRIMALNQANFNKIVESNVQMAVQLTTTLAGRIWTMYRNLGNTFIHDPFLQLLDMLVIQLEKAGAPIGKHNEPYYFDISLQDVANMCGMSAENQKIAFDKFKAHPYVKFNSPQEAITVLSCSEIFTTAVHIRKKATNE
ncbi:MAG: cyclic nucleotide-binding domain-containing protein [Treponemataceae bacterium]|nr:MAG: cyclic nucleotide-binding domain-containing protein [Treponemataceae bacterium]